MTNIFDNIDFSQIEKIETKKSNTSKQTKYDYKKMLINNFENIQSYFGLNNEKIKDTEFLNSLINSKKGKNTDFAKFRKNVIQLQLSQIEKILINCEKTEVKTILSCFAALYSIYEYTFFSSFKDFFASFNIDLYNRYNEYISQYIQKLENLKKDSKKTK